MRDRLASLGKLRRQEVENARKMLAQCLDIEARAERECTASDRFVATEIKAIDILSRVDGGLDVFGVWLFRTRSIASVARQQLKSATGETSCARANLIAIRAAAEAIEALQAQRTTRAAATAARLEQNDLDEMARHRVVSARIICRQTKTVENS
jgi:flagellar biosynthesis chaperone FliJ